MSNKVWEFHTVPFGEFVPDIEIESIKNIFMNHVSVRRTDSMDVWEFGSMLWDEIRHDDLDITVPRGFVASETLRINHTIPVYNEDLQLPCIIVLTPLYHYTDQKKEIDHVVYKMAVEPDDSFVPICP